MNSISSTNLELIEFIKLLALVEIVNICFKIMLLQKKENGTLVEILDIQEAISPNHFQIMVRVQSGQEEQDPEPIEKINLIFPSGESLPRCWMDADYQKEKSN